MFTVAYSARFLWGAFARKPGVADTPVHRPGPLLTWPAGFCALAGLVLGIANPVVDVDAQSYAAAYPADPPGEAGYHLALWHGLGLPLLLSAVALVLGYALHRARSTVGRLAGRLPRALTAQRAYELAVGGTERVATAVTGRLQVGLRARPTSAIILVAVVALPGLSALVGGSLAGPAAVAHASLQLPLGVRGDAGRARPGPGPPPVHRGAARRGDRLRRRRPVHRRRRPGPRAGAVPRRDAVAGRVRLRPAPDARPVHRGAVAGAGFRCPRRCSPRSRAGWSRRWRWCSAARARHRRRPAPSSSGSPREGAGATNVISAIIVDFRALDTVGEITVLFVAAVGVASLVLDDAARPARRQAAGERRRGRARGEARAGPA